MDNMLMDKHLYFLSSKLRSEICLAPYLEVDIRIELHLA